MKEQINQPMYFFSNRIVWNALKKKKKNRDTLYSDWGCEYLNQQFFLLNHTIPAELSRHPPKQRRKRGTKSLNVQSVAAAIC